MIHTVTVFYCYAGPTPPERLAETFDSPNFYTARDLATAWIDDQIQARKDFRVVGFQLDQTPGGYQ
jgi:hypothetical protein